MAEILAANGSHCRSHFAANQQTANSMAGPLSGSHTVSQSLGKQLSNRRFAAAASCAKPCNFRARWPRHGRADFPVFAPWEYVRRMQVGDPQDPLLLQVLAGELETGTAARRLARSSRRWPCRALPGLLHKYDRRVLMITTGSVCGPLPILLSPTLPLRLGPARPRGLGRVHCRPLPTTQRWTKSFSAAAIH